MKDPPTFTLRNAISFVYKVVQYPFRLLNSWRNKPQGSAVSPAMRIECLKRQSQQRYLHPRYLRSQMLSTFCVGKQYKKHLKFMLAFSV